MGAVDADVRDLLTSLQTAEDVEPAWEAISKWATARDLPRLREAAFALTEPSPDAPEWAVSSVRDYLVKKLALTPDREFALTFSLTGTQDEARAYAARRREGGPREELSTDDLHRSAGERVRRARYCGVGTPADCGRRAVPHKNWTKTACRSPGSGAPRSAFGSSGRAGYSPANRWC
jgi:hypothetical protein